MQLNLNPGKTSIDEMKGWLKQAHDLVWRKPFAFTLGLFISTLPGLLFWLLIKLLGFIDAEGVLNLVVFVVTVSMYFLVVCISPVGIVMSMIAEKADNNSSITWSTELFVIYSTSLKLFFKRTIQTAKFLAKCFFMFFMIALMLGLVFVILDYFFNIFSVANTKPLPLRGLDQVVSRPEPLFWISVFKDYSFIYIYNVLFAVTACPYFYALLIHKGVINSEHSHNFIMKNINSFDLMWVIPYAAYVLAIAMVLDFPTWHISGWLSVIGGILLTIYFWVFGYVVARDKFLGIKKNQEQESSETAGAIQSVEA